MTIRLQMLAAAREAQGLLGDGAERVRRFVRNHLQDDGGFCGRSRGSDLYYTVFGLEALRALDGEFPRERVAEFLRGFGDGAELDFVHLACLARCWANLPNGPDESIRASIARRLESYRAADGGYASKPRGACGTAYGCFLALSGYQDLDRPMPQAQRMAECLESLRAGDGGYANQRGSPVGLTPATAAAACVLCEMGRPTDRALGEWLLSRCGEGFFAVDGAPVPDLLSTATALHALGRLGCAIDPIRRKRCRSFVEGLQADSGGFRGHWADASCDCEYTYYGLLALGHLGPPAA
jgi:prenyltransferase beta subunit